MYIQHTSRRAPMYKRTPSSGSGGIGKNTTRNTTRAIMTTDFQHTKQKQTLTFSLIFLFYRAKRTYV